MFNSQHCTVKGTQTRRQFKMRSKVSEAKPYSMTSTLLARCEGRLK